MALPLTIRRLIVNQPADLPVFHPIAIQLQVMLESDDFKIEDVIEKVEADQSLAGQILKVANSTVYIGRTRSETIKEAVIRLGASHVSHLAMAVSQSNMHMSSNPLINDGLLSLWLHSHACAVGCGWVARVTGHHQVADRAYMAGLLHDIGKLYLLKAVERLNSMNVAMKAAEEGMMLEIFEELHIDSGVTVMQAFNMPKVYLEVAAKHDDPRFDPDDKLMVILRLVNQACRILKVGPSPGLELELSELPENDILKLGQPRLEELCDKLRSSQIQLPIPVEERRGERSYQVTRRPFNLGYELQLLEEGLDVETRHFPLCDTGHEKAEEAGQAWAASGGSMKEEKSKDKAEAA